MVIFKIIWLLINLVSLWFLPIYIIYCYIPNKNIEEGINDWLDESINDF